jgi:hypothetical protein
VTKVKFLNAASSGALEKEVNKFLLDKDVLSVSFSAVRRHGDSLWFYCSILYREDY